MAQSKPPFGTPLNSAHWASQGLVGCWLFNEGSGSTAYDSSGKGNHGTLSGSPLPAWTSDAFGGGLLFPSAAHNTAVTAPMPAGLTLPVTYIVGFNPASVTNSAYLVGVGNNVCATLFNAGYLCVYNGTGVFGASPLVQTGTTYITTVTFAANGTGTISLNGERAISGSAGTSAPSTSVVIGNRLGSSTGCANSTISFVHLWNRILSDQEISYLRAFPFAMFNSVHQNVRQIDSIPRNILSGY